MTPPHDPATERSRLDALARLGLSFDAEERFDRLTRLAARVTDSTSALITVVGAHEQRVKSAVGVQLATIRRDDSFCTHAIAGDAPIMVVPDATLDPRFVHNPLVTGDPRIRFYAGRVLREPGGAAIGTLCVLGPAARELSPDEAVALDDLAMLVEQELELTRHVAAEHDLRESLRRSEAAARTSLDALEQGVILTTSEPRVRRVNPAAERLLGYTADELDELWHGGAWATFDVDGNELPIEQRPVVRALSTGEPVRGELVGWRHKDGTMLTLRVSCLPGADDGTGLVIAFADVTEEQRMLSDLARFRYLFDNANDIITVVDETGRVLYASPSTQRILGYPRGWRHPGGILGIVHPDDLPAAAAELSKLKDGAGDSDPFLVRVQTFDGSWRSIECVGVNLLDQPDVNGIVITARDATERVQLAAELAHRASHDELTDLPSRRMLEARLADALTDAIRDDRRVGVCFIDLDGFKQVNDRLGHNSGDQLLVEVADRIRSSIRPNDLAARIGGDEFVVVVDAVSSLDEATRAAERIRDAVLAAGPGRDAATFGASVGLAVSQPDDTPASLLRRADAALYHAKEFGDSALAIGDPHLGPQLAG